MPKPVQQQVKYTKIISPYNGKMIVYFDRNMFLVEEAELKEVLEKFFQATTAVINVETKKLSHGIIEASFNPFNTTEREIEGFKEVILSFLKKSERFITADDMEETI